jgi:hypothetical protein
MFDSELDTQKFHILDLQIRKEALKVAGYEDINDALKAYGVACGVHYWDLAVILFIIHCQVRNSIVWLKYQKMKRGKLSTGDTPVLDLKVFDLDNKELLLSDLVHTKVPEIPTIIIAGSLTWPPFRTLITLVDHWRDLYGSKINIFCIYISEAHAEDEWPLSNRWILYQHKNIEDRITAAKLLQTKKNLTTPVYVDSFDSPNFESIYASWPERGYIFHNGKIEHICNGILNDKVNWHTDIQVWLEKNIGKYSGKTHEAIFQEEQKAALEQEQSKQEC